MTSVERLTGKKRLRRTETQVMVKLFEGIDAAGPREDHDPYRLIRKGEVVNPNDVIHESFVPESIYGGRRRREPLPAGMADRRKKTAI